VFFPLGDRNGQVTENRSPPCRAGDEPLAGQGLIQTFTPTTAYSDFAAIPDAALEALMGTDYERIGGFLGVQDTKDYSYEVRPISGIAVTVVTPGAGAEYHEVAISWPEGEPASDLEAVCHLPGRGAQFLVVESGYFGGRFGRVFHIELSYDRGTWTGAILDAARLPADAREIEGVSCLAQDGDALVVFGERGGDAPGQDGRFRWTAVTLGALPDTLSLSAKDVDSAPAFGLPRDVTGMYVDESGLLWVSSAEDRGEFGPFRSAVELIGRIDFDVEDPVTLFADPIVFYYTDTRKIEGVGAGILSGAHLSVVTEDEGLGGSWFPLHWGVGVPFGR
jgi:hypothetical protein